MKLYFHIQFGENKNNGKLTVVVDIIKDAKETKLKDTLEAICQGLLEKEKIQLKPQELKVLNGKTLLGLDKKVTELQTGADLKVTIKEKVCDATTKYERTVINKHKDQNNVTKSTSMHKENVTPEAKALLKKANGLLGKKRHDLAIEAYQEALKLAPDNYESLFGIAYIFYKAERYKDSISYFEKLVGKDSSNFIILLDYGRALTNSGNHKEAVSVISRCINDLKRGSRPENILHDSNVALGEALEAAGEFQGAFQLYLTISQMTDKQHVGALLGYARVGYKLHQVQLDDVFIVALNAIALHKDDQTVQKFFSEMVMEKGGLEALQKQMHTAWTDVQSVVFIATFLRKWGALKECMYLVKHAFSLTPKSVDVVLLKAHLHENLCEEDTMLTFVAEFLEGKLDRQVVRKIDLSVVSKAIRHISEEGEEMEALLNSSVVKDTKEPAPRGNMLDVELQLLALYFTVVKVFYIKGILKPIPLFLDMLDPLFAMNENIHKSLIRNEQAYYTCISRVFKHGTPLHHHTTTMQRAYMIGDSHVLPVAWQQLKVNEEVFVLEPVLLTGLKAWHLRADSKFYTKLQFEKAIQRIPDGSVCIFNFGEIDCREGISRAVEKFTYDNVDDSVKAVVDVYVKVLSTLQQRKKLKVFVHPVPPVLKETREIVDRFNACLKAKIAKYSKLMFLDFVNELLDAENVGLLKKEYEFDGAHLDPSYLALIQNSLGK